MNKWPHMNQNQKYFIDLWRGAAALQLRKFKVKNMQKNSNNNNDNDNNNNNDEII